MEASTTAILEQPEAEAAEALTGASAESASQPEATDAQINASMNAFFRGHLQPADSTSNPDDPDQAAEGSDATAGVSAPTGDVKPADGKPVGRRGAAARIAELEAENARLQKAFEEANPPPPDASEEARAAILKREQRFRDLNARPDEDPIFLEGDHYDWLQTEKRRRAVAPELRQHYETVVAEDIQANRAAVAAERSQFWDHVRADMATARDVPGVDFEAVKRAPTFAERDRLLYQAGRAQLEPEVRKLREELAQAKRDLLGSVRAPMGGGQSAPGRTYDENTYMNSLLRDGR